MQRPNATLLDIGFGTGTLTTKLYEHGCSVYGQDFSTRMIELAAKKMPTAHLYQGDFARGLAEPLMKQSYDFIVATYSLHHLNDEQKVTFLHTLQGCLNDNGQILIGDVAFETREELYHCRQSAGNEWDDEEIYFVADELRNEFPRLTFANFLSISMHYGIVAASGERCGFCGGNMKLDFYYYSYQCPLNDDMVQLLNKYTDKLNICYHDISNDFRCAKELKMFFPTLVVLDDKRRYYSPIRKAFLEQAAAGEYPEEKPYIPPLSEKAVTKCIEPLTAGNVELACDCCANKTKSNWCKKAQFLMARMVEPYGFIHKDENGRLLGGAEYLPAAIVPYDIPHDSKTAFITCVYMSDSEHDYKSAPLQALERYLCGRYARVVAITDEKSVFPNGDLRFFARNGYKDEGVIFEDENYCTLHLVSKQLAQ